MFDYDYERRLYGKFDGLENMSQKQREELYKIRDSISMDPDKVPSENNGYAYALGITKSRLDILPEGFVPGVIGAGIKGMSVEDVLKLPTNERLFLDLEALDIDYNEGNVYSPSPCKEIDGKLEWVIAMYEKRYRYHDIHFLRKDDKGFWSHKVGIFESPFFLDDEGEPIYDISNFNFQLENELYMDYDFSGAYELKLRR